jgi:hypothetical protein
MQLIILVFNNINYTLVNLNYREGIAFKISTAEMRDGLMREYFPYIAGDKT